ncbi:DGQHR domain-containing protein [Mesorhizobium sp. M0185]|uniref:DGQHR domain-containing protein n=1 Tax=unclassified Mesorhizobium TaxID=325217 RepID=UPI0033376675
MTDISYAEAAESEAALATTRIDVKSVSIALKPLLIDSLALAKAYKTRRSPIVKKTVHIADTDDAEAKGWKVLRRQKRVTVVQKAKSIAASLEDRVWCLCRDMGYSVLNGGAFKISYSRTDGSTGTKQIDVFAKDSETALVFECKSKEVRGRKSLQKDLHETAFLKKSVANAIRSHFGEGYNPKIVWIYVTDNIVWTEPDVARASGEGIRIITENELQYFEAFIKHVGSAGKYQFLAEFLKGQEIPALSGYKVPAVKGRLGTENFYSFTIPAGHLLKIAFVNHHALNNPDGTPAYQRMVEKKRLQSIGKFITDGGYFPTNILINFTDPCVFEPLSKSDNTIEGLKFGHLVLPNKFKSAWVIDGQHRLLGFTNLPEEYLKQPLFVVAFEQMATVKEAELFITINHKQKSVPASLLVALQADLQMGSDDPDEALSAISSFLIRKLALDSTSPFYGRFQTPGVPASDAQVLTVPEIQKGLKRSQLLGRVVKKVRLGGYLSDATDSSTLDRARRAINSYFRRIEDAVPEKWAAGRTAHIVTNPGIRAHLLLLNEVLRFQHAAGKIDPVLASLDEIDACVAKFCKPLIDWLKTADAVDIEARFAKQYGEGGVRDYFFHLCDLITSETPTFGPDEFRDYKAKSNDERRAQAKLDVEDMTKLISGVVVEKLKDIYGKDELPSGEKKYWELGIADSKIKQAAYNAQQQVRPEKRAPKEAYLHLIDFETIIKQKGNWEYFKTIFSIPLGGINPKSKEYHVDWIKEFNDIRNVASHSSIYRQLTDDDLNFLVWLKGVLYERCEAAEIPIDEF